MIVVRVELWSANTGKIIELGRMHISNVGVNEKGTMGDYVGQVLRKPDFKTYTRQGLVTKHPRLGKVIWVLIARMLKEMGYVA